MKVTIARCDLKCNEYENAIIENETELSTEGIIELMYLIYINDTKGSITNEKNPIIPLF